MADERRDERELYRRYGEATRPDPERVRRALAAVEAGEAAATREAASERHPSVRVYLAAAAVLALAVGGIALRARVMVEAPVGGDPIASGRHPNAPAVAMSERPEPAGGWPDATARLPEGVSTPLDAVTLTAAGSGDWGVEGNAVAVRWAVGTLDVEVTPDRGVDLVVGTPEARARVVGTGFQVERSALGTEVTVRHGVVEVRCMDAADDDRRGSAVDLRAGGTRLCLPTTPAGLLGRARALEAAGAPAAEVRAAAESGLGGDVSATIRGELETVRIRTFLAEGRTSDARAAAEAYLRSGYTGRRPEVLTLATELAAEGGDCAAARAWQAELGGGVIPGCEP